MARETTYAGILGNLQRLSGAMDANQEELRHLEPFRVKLGGIVTEALEISQEQVAITVRKQETSKLLRQFLNEGQRLATVVRAAVKEHYGIGGRKGRGVRRAAVPRPEGQAGAGGIGSSLPTLPRLRGT
jgi:hypothetical protein